jgi:hypothetical protein
MSTRIEPAMDANMRELSYAQANNLTRHADTD